MLSYIKNILHQIDESLTGTWPTPGQYALECPVGWQPKIKKAKPPKENRENVYVRDETKNEYGFRDKDFAGPSGNTSGGEGVETLTEYDAGLLVERFGNGNSTLTPDAWARAKDAKVCWHKQMTKEDASEHLKGMGYKASVSYVEKLFGTYSTSLDIEKADAEALQN